MGRAEGLTQEGVEVNEQQEDDLRAAIAKKEHELALLRKDLDFVVSYRKEQKRKQRMLSMPLGVDMSLLQDDGK